MAKGPIPNRSVRDCCFNGFAVRQTIDHNPKRERGTQGSAESLAHAAGHDLYNEPVSVGS
jgi:hypothetical protein